MESIKIIQTYDQLKAISDPLRTKILMYLVEKPYTCHQLAEELNLTRAKVLYHLRELEKYEFIKLVDKVEQGGNLLKYYQAVARGFIPADHLLNFVESQEATRQSYLEVLNRAKTRVLTAPDSSFEFNSSAVEEWDSLSLQSEVLVSKEKFLEFTKKYRELIDELVTNEKAEEKEKNNYYVMVTAFKIDESKFYGRT
ncbi:ArsR family transcriptional regulator [Rummeliibacillus sp. TYF005]|uniref:winged helix-turn-helix domain-containing protein n=1 Tax=Rummeliibacillus sp. TYF005 TaxID=2058214 RepID=UPI000F52DF0A|nr:winged helix-turn-helix domain-containing protein [Rummeliibacillus sp. TYF005]RPJ95242.1 ArsR family transcriptional regulator [Rummeliibacillus sp. TYF005]